MCFYFYFYIRFWANLIALALLSKKHYNRAKIIINRESSLLLWRKIYFYSLIMYITKIVPMVTFDENDIF